MPLDIVVGTQWGDEGKGRVVDLLSAGVDFVARFNGGDNAGHTVTVGDKTFKLHLVPSGIIHPHTIGAIGNGVVVNPAILLQEMEMLRAAGVTVSPARLVISHAAHLITPGHIALDKALEGQRGQGKIGTTLRGIGPAYTEKVARSGLRAGGMLQPERFGQAMRQHIERVNHTLRHLYQAEPLDSERIAQEFTEYAHLLKGYIGDVSLLLTHAMNRGQRVLAEGAQGTLLDLDHGTYPFVTSSNPTTPGALLGLGLGVNWVERVIGVTKAFQTRVGEGPFPSELNGDEAARLRGTGDKPWDEFGVTTGRPRRVGWLDSVLLRYAARVNGLTELVVTKLDVLSGLAALKICVAYRADGQELRELPFGPAELGQFEPIYLELPGWSQDVMDVRRWEDLPEQARAYVLQVEDLCGVPVRMVSVGPERDQVIEIG